MVDFVKYWSARTEIPVRHILRWLGLGTSKFHDWKDRYGKANEHNRLVPRDWWLEDWEKQAILDFHDRHPLEGYRRLTFMMLDADVVAVSPATVYRVLKNAGRLDNRRWAPSKKGTGFVQPLKAHGHWHVDVSYINLGGTFYYLCSVLDGYSRFLVHWELRAQMTEQDVETIIQRALDQHQGHVRPRIISDNGPPSQPPTGWLARLSHRSRLQGVHPLDRHDPRPHQSLLSPKQRQDRTLSRCAASGERWHASLKAEGIRPACPETLDDARQDRRASPPDKRNRSSRSAIASSRRPANNDACAGAWPDDTNSPTIKDCLGGG